jgi:hypothetical protein
MLKLFFANLFHVRSLEADFSQLAGFSSVRCDINMLFKIYQKCKLCVCV